MRPVGVQISPARPTDVDVVLAILDEVTVWLHSSGIPTVWKPGGFSRPTFLDQISKGEVFIVLVDSTPAGTFILQWSDVFWWGETPPDAGYVHKLAVRPAYSGRGLGLEMLRWAEARTRSMGRRILRLNCMAEDRKIRDYYESAGFSYVKDVKGPLAIASLYEKELTPSRSTI